MAHASGDARCRNLMVHQWCEQRRNRPDFVDDVPEALSELSLAIRLGLLTASFLIVALLRRYARHRGAVARRVIAIRDDAPIGISYLNEAPMHIVNIRLRMSFSEHDRPDGCAKSNA